MNIHLFTRKDGTQYDARYECAACRSRFRTWTQTINHVMHCKSFSKYSG